MVKQLNKALMDGIVTTDTREVSLTVGMATTQDCHMRTLTIIHNNY